MKKIFILAGLTILAAYGQADARSVKLGYGTSVVKTRKLELPKQCDISCLTCDTSTGTCTSCPEGKKPNGSGCVDYCYGVSCAAGFTAKPTLNGCCCEDKATQCPDGYSYNETYHGCVKNNGTACPYGCKSDGCSVGSTLKAETWNYLQSDGSCPACSTAIPYCYWCELSKQSKTLSCKSCSNGYYLDGKGGCTSQKPLRCRWYGQYQENGVCKDCPAGTFSKYETATKCTACPPGTYARSGSEKCRACSSVIQHCTECAPGGIGVKPACANCEAGYYLMDDGYCGSCSSGWGHKYSLGNATSCTESTPVANCKWYFATKDACGGCEDGYTLTDGKCIADS